LAELGLERGNTCVLILPSDEHCAGVLMGALSIGAIPLLIAPPTIQAQGRHSSLAEVVERVVKKVRPRLVIASAEMTNRPEGRPALAARTQFLQLATVEAPADHPRAHGAAAIAQDDVAALQLTSGTTGFPRICVWRQRDVIAAFDSMSEALALTEDDVCVNWTPLYHDMGLMVNFLLCLTTGVPIVMLDPVDFVRRPSLWLRALSAAQATYTWSPNFGFALAAERARDDELEGTRLDRVRAFFNSSERIHPDTVDRFHARFSPLGVARRALKAVYGGAEHIGAITVSDLQRPLSVEVLDQRALQERAIAQIASPPPSDRPTIAVAGVGRPCPGVELRIVSPRGRALSEGHIGEIAVKTDCLRTRYFKDVRATRRLTRGGLLHSGDLGYLRNGELFWVGRVSERIATMGRKFDPSDFEAALFRVPELRPGCFAAFGIDDSRLGTQRIAIVSEVRDSFSASARDVAAEVRRQVFAALGLTVDDVVLLPKGTLTKTSSGKRRHRHFRDLYLRGELESLRLPVSA
jgi:acyl-CoA synthetase (AMP-forming)/AMP-acid ligase II